MEYIGQRTKIISQLRFKWKSARPNLKSKKKMSVQKKSLNIIQKTERGDVG